MGKKIDVSKGAYLKGDSHDAPSGGIKATVVDTGQEILVEGNEVVLNKKSMASNKEYTVTGTPKEIASAVNSIDGNGVKFDTGATLKDHETGEVKKMAKGGVITEAEANKWFFENKKKLKFTKKTDSKYDVLLDDKKIGDVTRIRLKGTKYHWVNSLNKGGGSSSRREAGEDILFDVAHKQRLEQGGSIDGYFTGNLSFLNW